MFLMLRALHLTLRAWQNYIFSIVQVLSVSWCHNLPIPYLLAFTVFFEWFMTIYWRKRNAWGSVACLFVIYDKTNLTFTFTYWQGHVLHVKELTWSGLDARILSYVPDQLPYSINIYFTISAPPRAATWLRAFTICLKI